jgi:23S rRNA (adenine2030-N6)-methyltransferase
MNYRHNFHAGNFGDVLKHALLLPLLRGMQRKEKGFLYIDTHAGLGSYDLTAAPAGRTLEFTGGIGRLWEASAVPEPLREYLELVRRFNRDAGVPAGVLRFYPGSPQVATMVLRPQDRVALSELHPEDFEVLRKTFAHRRSVSVQRIDAYSALLANLPPPERRALALIDPPYEDANETSRLHAGLEAALRRWPAATLVVWHPIKEPAATEGFKAVLLTLELPPTLAVDFILDPAFPPGRLNGCGLLVLNPPWRIADELAATAEAVREALAGGTLARTRLEWLREED